ncbi:hypothetical protein [Nonomuraea sp. NPDC002799]
MDRTQYLGYTPAIESRRLLDHGLPKELPETLGGRHRFTPLSLCVGDRLAAAAFARLDEVGLFWLDVWLLSQKRGGRWHVRDGRSDPAGRDDDLLTPRPATAVLSGHATTGDTTRLNINADRRIPWPRKFAGYGVIRLSAEVGAVRFGGLEITVPDHGLQAVAWWRSRKPTTLDLLDHKSERISAITLR